MSTPNVWRQYDDALRERAWAEVESALDELHGAIHDAVAALSEPGWSKDERKGFAHILDRAGTSIEEAIMLAQPRDLGGVA